MVTTTLRHGTGCRIKVHSKMPSMVRVSGSHAYFSVGVPPIVAVKGKEVAPLN